MNKRQTISWKPFSQKHKMPGRCLECPFYDNYNYCILYSFGIPARYNLDGSTRPEWCEIKELPPAQLTYTDGEVLKMQDLEQAQLEKAYQLGYEEGKKDAQTERKKMSNKEWVDFLSEQFSVSRTSAREMLHGLMRWKAEDNFKKQFSGGRNETD